MRTLPLIFSMLILFGYTYSYGQRISSKIKEDIIGTWIPDEDGVDYRWEFSQDGICKRYSQGNVLLTFNYTVTIELSLDGTLKFNVLELVNVNDLEDKYTYTANIVDNNRLYLVYDLRPGSSIRFSRQ